MGRTSKIVARRSPLPGPTADKTTPAFLTPDAQLREIRDQRKAIALLALRRRAQLPPTVHLNPFGNGQKKMESMAKGYFSSQVFR